MWRHFTQSRLVMMMMMLELAEKVKDVVETLHTRWTG